MAGHRAGPRRAQPARTPVLDAYLSLVPTQLAPLLDRRPTSTRWRGFDAVLVGGGPVDPALRSRAAEAGVRVVATYG